MASELTFDRFDEAWATKRIGKVSPKGIDGYLGIAITEFSPGRLVAGFDVTGEIITMIGNIHGGCISTLVDHVLGVVMYPVMPEGSWAATTEFKLNLLRPVSQGRVDATATIVSMSKRLAVIRIDVENEGRLAAVAQGTSTIVAPRG